MNMSREERNRSIVRGAVGLYGNSIHDVLKGATREIVDGETGQTRALMTNEEASMALLYLMESGRLVRTGYGNQARFDMS